MRAGSYSYVDTKAVTMHAWALIFDSSYIATYINKQRVTMDAIIGLLLLWLLSVVC